MCSKPVFLVSSGACECIESIFRMPMTQAERRLKVPFTTRLARVHNYAQATAELRMLQKRLAGVARSPGSLDSCRADAKIEEDIRALGNVFTSPEPGISTEDILDGFLHQRVKRLQHRFEEKVLADFARQADAVVEEMKKSQQFKSTLAHTIHPKDIEYLERSFDRPADASAFSKPVVAELYAFLCSSALAGFQQERLFLERQFLNYIKRFYKENADKIHTRASTIEDRVREFVKMRYNKMEYNIEVFEGRYIYAEIYVFLRCGLRSQVRGILGSFSLLPAAFVEKVSSYLDNPARVLQGPPPRQTEDRFKQLVLRLVSSPESVQADHIVSTLEDYLWTKHLAAEKGVSVRFEEVLKETKAPVGRLLACVLGRLYAAAQETLLGGGFTATDAYYLCMELNKRERLESAQFVNFVFMVAQRFSSAERKARIVLSLPNLGPEDAGRKIAEYEMYVVAKMLPSEHRRELVSVLRRSNNKKALLRLYFINDDEQEIACLLEEALSEAVASERAVHDFRDFEYSEIYFYLEERRAIEKYPRLEILKDFLVFKARRDLVSLQKTVLLDEARLDMLNELDCIDAVVIIASEVVAGAESSFFAHRLMGIAGKLKLNEHAHRALLKNLIAVL